MIEFILSYGSDIILGTIVAVCLLTLWVARKIWRASRRKSAPEKVRRTKNQEITQSLHLKMKEIQANGHPRHIKRLPSISLEVLDIDVERVDLEATIASYWNGQ